MRRTGTSIRRGYTFTVGDGTLPAACEEAAQALEEGQFSGVVEADDGFYLILRKPLDLDAVAPDYFDALLQAAADSADVSTTRTYEDLDVEPVLRRAHRRPGGAGCLRRRGCLMGVCANFGKMTKFAEVLIKF